VLDLHAHILPGIDDGPANEQESLAMAEAALAHGVRTIAATPHIDHSFMVDPLEIPGRVEHLNSRLRAAEIPLGVVPGGEVALHRLLELDDAQLNAVHLGSGRHILLEPPFAAPVPALDNLVFELQARGHQVLIAHPERCAATANVDRAAALVERGALLQLTASSLLGKFGGPVRKISIELLACGLVDVLASDAHGATSRSMDLAGALEAAEREIPGITSHLEHLTVTAPAAILAGEALPERPPMPARRKGLLARLRGGA
jgi:protein-tyrosine phosphatase